MINETTSFVTFYMRNIVNRSEINYSLTHTHIECINAVDWKAVLCSIFEGKIVNISIIKHCHLNLLSITFQKTNDLNDWKYFSQLADSFSYQYSTFATRQIQTNFTLQMISHNWTFSRQAEGIAHAIRFWHSLHTIHCRIYGFVFYLNWSLFGLSER